MSYKRPTKVSLPVGKVIKTFTVPKEPICDTLVYDTPDNLPSANEIEKLLSGVTYHGHPLFPVIVDELKELHSIKNKQYATSENPLGNFNRVGNMIKKFIKPGIDPTLAACLFLMAKQIDGVYEIIGENKKRTVESVYDKLKDTAVYSIIAMIILKELEKNGSNL